MDESCQSPISCCRSLPPHCLLDQKRLFTQSSSPQSGSNASAPPQPPHRDWQRRLRPNEPTLPEVPSWSTTKTSDVFLEEAFAHLPPCKAWDHAIELHPDTKLPRGRTFPLSPTEQKELDEILRENLANRCIHPSKSPIGAPVFFIKKKEGSLCLVQDYWKLNEITIKNSYPLLLVSDMLTRLCDAE